MIMTRKNLGHLCENKDTNWGWQVIVSRSRDALLSITVVKIHEANESYVERKRKTHLMVKNMTEMRLSML